MKEIFEKSFIIIVTISFVKYFVLLNLLEQKQKKTNKENVD